MFKSSKLQPLNLITPMFGGVLLGIIGLQTPNTLANPIVSNSTLVDKIQVDLPSQVSPSCPSFTPIPNTYSPNDSTVNNKNTENLVVPTSVCAADLADESSPLLEKRQYTPFLVGEETGVRFVFPASENLYIVQESVPSEEIQPITASENEDEWHFKFQPYATIPISTYGTATARGRTIDYSLSLGEVLQNLRATASGRFEAWKGRWGFIVDGYYVSLQGIASFQRTAERIPNTIDALNYVLSKDVNTRVQEIANTLEQDVEKLQQIQALRESEPLQSLDQRVQTLQATAAQDAQALRDALDQRVQTIQATAAQDAQTLRELDQEIQFFDQRVQTIQATAAQDAQTLRDALGQRVQTLQETAAQDAQTLRDLDQQIQSFRDTVVAQDEPRLQALDFKLQDFQQLGLNSQALKEIITLNNRDVDRLPREQQLDTKIQNALTKLNNLEQLQQELTDIKELLEQTRQEIREQRAIKESEDLQKLETDIENVQATLERDIAAIDKIKDFSENRLPQELDASSTTDLQFDQGIYDFALSYHIGDLPMYELPEKPSNRSYPLLWFQPIAGVRLNDISIQIDETIGLSLTSSLISFQGTFQQTFTQGRTWFEPMLGGKIGLQIADPVIFWVRGDVSGFGLAGDTDLSWNVFFGIDWWVRQNISLQFAYHFYEISYKNGSGNNAFGLEQNLNGPYLSATFHF